MKRKVLGTQGKGLIPYILGNSIVADVTLYIQTQF